MSDINFLENENEFAVHRKTARETKSLTALLQKFGFAKDDQQARYILLGIATVSVLIAIFIFSQQFSSGGGPHISGEQARQLMQQGKYPMPTGIYSP